MWATDEEKLFRDIIITFTATSETLQKIKEVFSNMKTLRYGLTRLGTTQIALLGILMALEIVIGRFTFGPASVKVSFTFIVAGLIAKWFGPYWAMIAAFFTDAISTLISGGGYFWGFAISALVAAFIYGTSFYNRDKIGWVRAIITVILVLLIVNTVMNTIWIVILGGISDPHAIASLIWLRGIKELIFIPIQSIILYVFLNNQAIDGVYRRLMNRVKRS